MEAVNLLPPEHRPTGRLTTLGAGLTPDRVLPIGGAVAGVVVLFLASFYVYERSVVSSKQNALASQQAQLAAIQSRAQVVQDAETQVTARTTVVNSVIGARMVWDSSLGDLARVLPGGVQLTALQATAPVAPVPVAPVAPTTSDTSSTSSTSSAAAAAPAPVAPVAPAVTFTMSGTAPSHVRVALILDRLALLPWLSDVSLQTSNRLPTGAVQFTATATVQTNGGH
jgi:Tfp pilus assembly protein PilN